MWLAPVLYALMAVVVVRLLAVLMSEVLVPWLLSMAGRDVVLEVKKYGEYGDAARIYVENRGARRAYVVICCEGGRIYLSGVGEMAEGCHMFFLDPGEVEDWYVFALEPHSRVSVEVGVCMDRECSERVMRRVEVVDLYAEAVWEVGPGRVPGP